MNEKLIILLNIIYLNLTLEHTKQNKQVTDLRFSFQLHTTLATIPYKHGVNVFYVRY